MVSALETLGPVLAAFPTAEAPLTPDNTLAIERLTSAIETVAVPDLASAMIGPDQSFRIDYRGVAALIDGWRDWLAPYESFRMEIDEVIESDGVLVTCVRQFGTPVGGGPELVAQGAAVWWLRDGRLVRVEFNLDREAALRSAGLGP
ncbi:MAG TPA: nuclear transport factor 2 family protein [Solirubrobacterales bacterium]|nr:nuclear transport factor 2 family protein [Solirubrobacterales bacterium]